MALVERLELFEGEWVYGSHDLELGLELLDPAIGGHALIELRAGCGYGDVRREPMLVTEALDRTLETGAQLGLLDIIFGGDQPKLLETTLGHTPLPTKIIEPSGYGLSCLGLSPAPVAGLSQRGIDDEQPLVDDHGNSCENARRSIERLLLSVHCRPLNGITLQPLAELGQSAPKAQAALFEGRGPHLQIDAECSDRRRSLFDLSTHGSQSAALLE